MNHKKVLIADDSELNRAILVNMLEHDFEIIEVSDGKEAIAALESYQGRIAALLLDLVMPEMDGFDVLRVMQCYAWQEEIPVIVISAAEDTRSVERAYDMGVADYIRRPFNLTVTQRRVSNALTLYARQKHLVHLAEEQVYEHEKTNSAIINILSLIVESRNFESGTHILHVRAITDILLRQLVAATNRCPLSQARIPTRSGSSGPKAAGIDRSRRFLWNGAQNRKEAS